MAKKKPVETNLPPRQEPADKNPVGQIKIDPLEARGIPLAEGDVDRQSGK
jgi:hypothetical protein